MNLWKHDPGPCPICGAAHSACTDDSDNGVGPIVTVSGQTVTITPRPALKSTSIPLAPGEQTTATYRGTKTTPPIRRPPGGKQPPE